MFDMVGYTEGGGGAVGIAIGYIGLIAFWLGLMKLAEKAGLVAALSHLIAPLFRIIFPNVPKDHPASGANVVTGDHSDWATNCPEYKVTAVQAQKVTQPSDWQKRYRRFSELQDSLLKKRDALAD